MKERHKKIALAILERDIARTNALFIRLRDEAIERIKANIRNARKRSKP